MNSGSGHTGFPSMNTLQEDRFQPQNNKNLNYNQIHAAMQSNHMALTTTQSASFQLLKNAVLFRWRNMNKMTHRVRHTKKRFRMRMKVINQRQVSEKLFSSWNTDDFQYVKTTEATKSVERKKKTVLWITRRRVTDLFSPLLSLAIFSSRHDGAGTKKTSKSTWQSSP